ncbi:hypothetical protein N7519_000084 [Penicillium mononematosum]|uniref:uncharacterized protein n=1 Tax=Penicillium mononematosum TaxID=268346 RepID=UPI00254935B1|nr:uncharacterized protein N7519_000084 [Penicillium mononematosum]KAJ6190063.1 hypothetical protein N7519_000084 [Penicillium mononematosum]
MLDIYGNEFKIHDATKKVNIEILAPVWNATVKDTSELGPPDKRRRTLKVNARDAKATWVLQVRMAFQRTWPDCLEWLEEQDDDLLSQGERLFNFLYEICCVQPG